MVGLAEFHGIEPRVLAKHSSTRVQVRRSAIEPGFLAEHSSTRDAGLAENSTRDASLAERYWTCDHGRALQKKGIGSVECSLSLTECTFSSIVTSLTGMVPDGDGNTTLLGRHPSSLSRCWNQEGRTRPSGVATFLLHP